MSKVNPHFSEKTYLRMALEGASDIPANPTTRQMEALVGAGEGSGGGSGSGDFSIAHVTLVDAGEKEDAGNVTCIMVWETPEGSAMGQMELPVAEEAADLVLYKGRQYLEGDIFAIKSVSGNAELSTEEEDWYCIVTGDCTIEVYTAGIL